MLKAPSTSEVCDRCTVSQRYAIERGATVPITLQSTYKNIIYSILHIFNLLIIDAPAIRLLAEQIDPA
jgi:hypothetical protein